MITLTKSGIFYTNNYIPGHKNYVHEKVESIISHLSDVVEIDEDFTLLDFFSIIEEEEEIMEIIFSSHLGRFPLEPFLEEIKKDCPPDSEEDLDYIFCSWDIDQFDYALYYEKHKNDKDPMFGKKLTEPKDDDVNEVSIAVGVHGWGKHEPSEEEPFDPDMPYTSFAIEFTPLYRMKHLPLKLNEDFIIRPENTCGNEEPVVEGKNRFTVFEVFGAILSEISFCGSPDDRDAQWEDISETVDEAKKRLKDEERKKDEQ